MIIHIKYNYRTDSSGDTHVDWVTVGEKASFQMNERDNIDVTIENITVDDNNVAHINCKDDNNSYTIDQPGVHFILRQFPKDNG